MSELDKVIEIRPGRVAALFPSELIDSESDSAAIARIQDALETARKGDVRFVQSLVPFEAIKIAAWLNSCGFSHVTNVLSLAYPLAKFSALNWGKDLQLIAFDQSPPMQRRLSEVILKSYEDSADCPQLNNLRPINEVLASYRAVGELNRQKWFVALLESAVAGCILLVEHPAENEWEIVYVGVAPQFRRQGLGRKLIHHAQNLAAKSTATVLSAVVDEANHPALAIYSVAGFEIRGKFRLFLRLM